MHSRNNRYLSNRSRNNFRNAHPNPFNNSVSIFFEMANSKNVNLSIFDMKGRSIRQMNLGVLSTGFHKVLWDGKNNLGNELSSGIYMTILEVGEKISVQKISLIK